MYHTKQDGEHGIFRSHPERAPLRNAVPIRPTQDHCEARVQQPPRVSIVNSAGGNTFSLLNIVGPPKPVFRLRAPDGEDQRDEPITASSGEFYGRRDKAESAQAGNVRELFHTPILRRVTLCM